MTELNGLTQIATQGGTLHSIEPEPRPEDFASRGQLSDYEQAHHDWYVRTNFWRVEKR